MESFDTLISQPRELIISKSSNETCKNKKENVSKCDFLLLLLLLLNTSKRKKKNKMMMMNEIQNYKHNFYFWPVLPSKPFHYHHFFIFPFFLFFFPSFFFLLKCTFCSNKKNSNNELNFKVEFKKKSSSSSWHFLPHVYCLICTSTNWN